MKHLYFRAKQAKCWYGKSLSSQLLEILWLRWSFSRLGASEYYDFGLYDDQRYSFEEKRAFLGWRGRRTMDRTFNDIKWHVLHADKVVTHLLLKQLGIPSPAVKAVFDVQTRKIPGITYLVTKGQLETFLSGSDYPLFLKPVDAALGRGAIIIKKYDHDRKVAELAGGKEATLEAIYRMCLSEAQCGRGGYLFQEVVRPGSEISELSGGRLAGLRLIVLNAEGHAHLTHALIKIPTGTNVTDNFDSGKSGNLLGRVDSHTGIIEEIFRLGQNGYQPIDVHPDTGKALRGFTIPNWERYQTLLLEAASAFPGIRLQHWDVAIAEHGPQFLEINMDGCLELPQIACRRGFFDGRIKESYERIVEHVPTRGVAIGAQLELA